MRIILVSAVLVPIVALLILVFDLTLWVGIGLYYGLNIALFVTQIVCTKFARLRKNSTKSNCTNPPARTEKQPVSGTDKERHLSHEVDCPYRMTYLDMRETALGS